METKFFDLLFIIHKLVLVLGGLLVRLSKTGGKKFVRFQGKNALFGMDVGICG